MSIYNLLEIVQMEKPNKMMQFLILLESIDLHLGDISHSLKSIQNELGQKEKSTQKEKGISSKFGGGIRGGDKKGGMGGNIGGEHGGGILNDDLEVKKPKESGKALKDYCTKTVIAVDFFNGIIKKHLTAQEIGYIESRPQMIHAYKAFEKLEKLGYDEKHINQALYNAFNDGFWANHIRHFKALANTSKNGSLVIVNLLKINANMTKLTTPVVAQYKG